MWRIILALWLALAPAWADGISVPGVPRIGGDAAFSYPPSTGASYSGPGDITTFLHWYGLRGYSAAYASPGTNCAIDIEDQAGANPLTCVHILSTGALDVATISAWVTAHSVTTIEVSKIYDQVGTANLTQATLAKMPTLILSGVTGLGSSLPAMLFTRSSSQALTGGTISSQSQPFTISFVGNRPTSQVGSGQEYVVGDNGNIGAGWTTTANTLGFYASTSVTATASDTSFHAAQMIANGASGNIYADGTSNVLNAGSASFGAAIQLGVDFYNNYMGGYVCEAGLAAGAFTVSGGGIASLVNSNQHTYWGF